MDYSVSPLGAIIKGAIAGYVGTIALSEATKWVTSRQTAPDPAPAAAALSESPPSAAPAPRPKSGTMLLADRFSSCLLEERLTLSQEQAWAQAVHYGYGSSWGVLYGLLAGTFQWPALIAGPLYGVLVWTAGHIFLLPRFKLAAPPTAIGNAELTEIGLHAFYGMVIAIVNWTLQ